jgi:hypothetical protein
MYNLTGKVDLHAYVGDEMSSCRMKLNESEMERDGFVNPSEEYHQQFETLGHWSEGIEWLITEW